MYIECIVFGKVFQLLKNTDQRGSVKVYLFSPFTPGIPSAPRSPLKPGLPGIPGSPFRPADFIATEL